MTRDSIAAIASSPNLTDEDFDTQVTKLMERHVHIGINLRDIASPERRHIVLHCLANATGLRTVDLDASNMLVGVPEVLAATGEMSKRNPQLSRFVVNVRVNYFGDTGVQELAKNNTITQLDVSNNSIGDAGAQALATNTTITDLEVHHNNIGPAGKQALRANTTITQRRL